MIQSRLFFQKSLPNTFEFKNSILIYDQFLEKSCGKWISRFPRRYAVLAGEKLKTLKSFEKHIEKIHVLATGLGKGELQIVALGGGSVGDFAGFVASVYRRGVPLIHVPSTWLAAVDSAHGGKTALNLAGAKNQLGTFYPALRVYLIREVLESNSPERCNEALSEIVKVALLQGGSFWIDLRGAIQKSPLNLVLWKFLKPAILAKMQIVQQDPLEETGDRHLLNFGHTLGHLIEAELRVPHGRAVGLGLRFALVWSTHIGLLSLDSFSKAAGALPSQRELVFILQRLQKSSELLNRDKKKIKNGKIRFVFLRSPGRPVIRSVTSRQIQLEIQRQIRG